MNDEQKKAIANTVEEQVRSIREDAEKQITSRLREIEKEVTRSFRNRFLTTAGLIVALAAAATLLAMLTTTKDVNSGVITLQNEIIKAQNSIKGADQELIKATKSVADARNELTKAQTDLQTQNQSALQALKITQEELTKAKTDYQQVGWLDSRINAQITARKSELKGDAGQRGAPGTNGSPGSSGTPGVAPEELERFRKLADGIEERIKELGAYRKTFEKVTASNARMTALARFKSAPPEGWAIYGEPCTSDDGHAGRHPLMHNRQFDRKVTPANGPPVEGEVVVAREFVTVWGSPPKKDDLDKSLGVRETYPPEETAFGIIVPGQEVKITKIHPIYLGHTFVEFTLRAE